MKRSVMFVLICAVFPLSAWAQQVPIEHIPGECLKGDDKNVIEARLASTGEPRCYYRVVGSEEWCWVIGERAEYDPSRATFILPKLRSGIELDYFFLTLDSTPEKSESEESEIVTGKSPSLFRIAVRDRCANPVARSSSVVLSRCGVSAAPLAIAVAYTIGEEVIPPVPSPSNP